MEDYRELKIEADTFDKMRADTNFILQRALGMMKEKDSMEGKVTISLDIKLVPEFIPNFDKEIEGETRKILKPQFAHKVSSAINIKNEKKGNIEPEMAMIWDEDSQSYVLAHVNNTDQRSIFDTDFQETMYESYGGGGIENSSERDYLNVLLLEGEVADENALPGEVADGNALPGPVAGEAGDSEDAIDDDYGYEEAI